MRHRLSAVRTVALACIVLAPLAACGSDDGPTAQAEGGQSAAAEETATLRLGYFPNVTHAPALVGIHDGILAKALGGSVTLEPTPFNAGPEAVEALFAGAIDATFIGPNPAINAYARSGGDAVRIVAGTTSGGAFLVVSPDVASAEDLRGKTVASPQLGGTQDVALRSWLLSQGLETDTAQGGGVARYQLRVTSGGDTITQNDVAFGAAQVEGPATVLVVEGRSGNGATLTAALRAAGIEVRTASVTDIPPIDELAGISSTVLVDVDARTLAPEHLAALTAATRDLGRGLVTVGGTQSYGLGGYRGTDLEALLPVESEILDPKRRQTVAEVLAIDTSGSMGACHCAEGNNGVVDGNSMEGGVNKTDISRAGAARAIESLADIDEVGILAVDTRERWLIDLQQIPAEDVVTSGLRKLVPSGDATDLSRSLSTSAEALRSSNAALKHVILFTDGFTDPAELEGLEADAAELLEEGITVSVVATGEGASTELGAIAEAGGGRYYPGRDLQEVPDIIADEAVLASRDFLQEGRFVAQVTSTADPVAGLTEAPPVLGYVATTARPLATTHLRVGEDGDPLLASWQVGLGRVTSWTSDLDRWGQLWTSWPGFVEHWAGVVKDTYPTGEQSGAVRARVTGDVLRVEVEGAEDFPDGATGTARVVRPDGEVDEVRLTRDSADRFTGEIEVSAAGSYAVGATVGAGQTVSVAGTTLATRSYSAEYVPGEIEREALEALAARTGGRGAIEPAAAFDSAGLAAGQRRIPLAGWLLLAAALLWPLSVACSRLSLRTTTVAASARTAGATVTRRLRAALPKPPGRSTSPAREDRATDDRRDGRGAPTPAATAPPPAEHPPEQPPRTTLGSLLDAKRARREGAD